MATFHVSKAPIDEIEAELLLLAVPEGVGPLLGSAGLADWRLGGKLSAMLRARQCSGSEGDRTLLLNAPKLASTSAVLSGIGSLKGVGANEAADRLISALIEARKAGAAKVAIAADYFVGEGRPFASANALSRVLGERSLEQSKMLPSDVTLTVLDLDLF